MRNFTTFLSGAIALTLGGCGGRIYHPAANAFGKSVEAMKPVLDSDLAEFPNELRSLSLRRADRAGLAYLASHPIELLCKPVATSVRIGATAGKLGTAADSLIDVSGESPEDFPSLAAATLTRYSVSSGDINPDDMGSNAKEECQNDVLKYDAAVTSFTRVGGAEAGALALGFSGLTELWGLIKPVATGVLGFIDQQRRERAILAFIRSDGEKLEKYVASLADFSKAKAGYERAEAARLFSLALAPAGSGTLTDDQRSAILEAASTYDALRAIDPTSSYEAVGKSIGRLRNVAAGKRNREDMSAAISGFGESFATLSQISKNIAELEKGGEKHEALKAAIGKIKGKKPKAAAAD